ncbi:MMPL family transporter [Streptomyces sp. NPDC051776]|uniref:MMPL family transporter n=1 Tax=Streptomyces sp. NPDC051776 TaxID=3155414 RepID=UPI003448D0DF
MAERSAAALRRFRRQLVIVWIVALAAAGFSALSLPDRLSGGGWYVPGSESRQAVAAMESGFAGRGASNILLVVRDGRHAAGSAQFGKRVGAVMREVTRDRRLESVGSYGWNTLSASGRARFVGEDRHTAVTLVGLRLDDGTARRVLPDVQAAVADRYAEDGLRVALVSAGSFWGEINALSQKGLSTAESIAFPLILLILLWLYRGVVATVTSFVVSMTALVLAFGVLSLIARGFELSIFVQNAALMIGLGVGIDYALFIISRFQEELRKGRDRFAALETTLRTSGETVVFSGLVIVLSMSSLFLVDLNVIRSIALGIVVVVVFAVLASVVVLPALLYVLGDRIFKGTVRRARRGRHARRTEDGRWHDLAHRVMRRPALSLMVSVLALAALAGPALSLRSFTPDARILPRSSPVRWGFETMREQFGPGTASPIQVVVRSPRPLDSGGGRQVAALEGRLAGLDHVRRVDSPLAALREARPERPFSALTELSRLPSDARRTIDRYVSTDRRTAVLEVVADDFASSESTRHLLTRVRTEAQRLSGGVRADVGGETAEGVDANAVISEGLPAVGALMLLMVYLVLLATFRSVLLPVKAIVMNLLSVGATYGVLVLVFQHGLGLGLLGGHDFGYLQNFVPILLLAILVSLSTDYEVFLLNRVREGYLAGEDNTASVARGVSRTAPLITGAALLMLAVFGAFTFTGIMPIQQLGFGLAVGILLDATVVRLIVVPASMKLMGRWNWWMPRRRPPSPVRHPAPRTPVPGPAADQARRQQPGPALTGVAMTRTSDR